MLTFPVMESISPAGAYTMSILYGHTSGSQLFINNAYVFGHDTGRPRVGQVRVTSISLKHNHLA